MDADNGWVKPLFRKGYSQNPSNVTRIARAISSEDDDHHAQVVYYQAGIGTGIGLYSHLMGGGTGLGLAENIREAYAFLASNYREEDSDRPGVPPDSIFLIGFSRGAFTARSIAGLIGAIGLLKKKAMPHFYEAFLDWENAGRSNYTPLFFDRYFEHHDDVEKKKPDIELARDRNRIKQYLDEYLDLLLSLGLTQEVQVKSIGVWDTVGALGVPINPIIQRLFPFLPSFIKEYSWFDTNLDRHINNAFQALALDEHRYPYSPTIWEKPNDPKCKTNLKQVWFPGAHSNVGGSYADSGVADITLAWMMDQLSGNSTAGPDDRRPLDWIKFDESYIDYWTEEEVDWNESHKDEQYRGWAMGRVYDSNSFPQSLIGTKIRTPGRNHPTDWQTGKPLKHRMLRDTNEYVHSSVRVRIDFGGNGVEPDWAKTFPNGLGMMPWVKHLYRRLTGAKIPTYRPHVPGGPLQDWHLEDGHESHAKPNLDIDMSSERRVRWVYDGSERCDQPIMREDHLGPFEQRLLKRDQEIAGRVVRSNGVLSWQRERAEDGSRRRSPRPSRTL